MKFNETEEIKPREELVIFKQNRRECLSAFSYCLINSHMSHYIHV